MADRRERSAQEREAARLERERKRAARLGKPPPPAPPPPVSKPVSQAPVSKPAASQPRVSPPPASQPPVSQPPPASQPSPVSQPPPRSRPVPVPRDPEPVTVSSRATPSPLAARPQPERDPEPAEQANGAGQTGETGEHELEFDTGEHGPETGEHDLETGEHDLETGDHELEIPAGTRRVSAREKQPKIPRKPKKPKRPRLPGEKRRHSWIGRIASLVALALAGGLIWFLIMLFQPFAGSAHGRVTVTIAPHSSSNQIADTLKHDGVISSSFFFKLRATLAGERDKMRPGVYHLQLGMSYGSVLTALTKAPPAAKVTELTITEGRRRKAIDTLLRSQHVKGSYLAATRSSKLINPHAYGLRHKPPSLEGFLFPDTYQLVEPVKIDKLVADQLSTFKQEFAKVNLSYAHRHHLTPYDVLIIASLIEAETPTAHDRPLVASVIYNRLANGMALQLDSTTQYATGNYTKPLTVSQLHSRSPYNTRTHVGLPPTPIDSPGMASLQAAVHPAQTKYLFFFAKPCARGSVFANNYSQFLGQNRRYQSKHC